MGLNTFDNFGGGTPCIALTSATVAAASGNSERVCENQTFTVTYLPVTATTPVTYVWDSDGLVSGQGTATAVYNWGATCGKNASVTVSNACSSVSDSLAVALTLHLAQIAEAIQTTLETNMTAALLTRVYGWDELPEGVNDTPSLMCYLQRANADAITDTDRYSFSGVRNKSLTFNIDYFASVRNNLQENNERLTNAMTEIIDILETASSGACVNGSGHCPPFGLCALKTFQWNCERVIFENYGGIDYYGARCEVIFRVF